MQEIILENGKYTFRNPDGINLLCLRYGEGWRDFLGDNAVNSLFDHAIELEESLEIWKKRVDTLEGLRPFWAKGFSDDSIAAQMSCAALSQIFRLLGVVTQTDAVKKIATLTAKVERLQGELSDVTEKASACSATADQAISRFDKAADDATALRQRCEKLEKAAEKFRKAFVIAVGEASPYAKQSLEIIDKALADEKKEDAVE